MAADKSSPSPGLGPVLTPASDNKEGGSYYCFVLYRTIIKHNNNIIFYNTDYHFISHHFLEDLICFLESLESDKILVWRRYKLTSTFLKVIPTVNKTKFESVQLEKTFEFLGLNFWWKIILLKQIFLLKKFVWLKKILCLKNSLIQRNIQPVIR